MSYMLFLGKTRMFKGALGYLGFALSSAIPLFRRTSFPKSKNPKLFSSGLVVEPAVTYSHIGKPNT
ncbi:MAG: hypothetical protein KH899_09335, partial [Haemophilus pittmaniae]|uniref:hypothetical protein n=1 Tax=Haemophilus pittmaniae TaxID=249188 RepID=UPI0023F23C69